MTYSYSLWEITLKYRPPELWENAGPSTVIPFYPQVLVFIEEKKNSARAACTPTSKAVHLRPVGAEALELVFHAFTSYLYKNLG